MIENPPSREYEAEDAVDPRNISIALRYSFIQMPSNEFEPRIADQRIGFFTTKVTDLTSTDITPYSDLIHKWNLKKKFPNKENPWFQQEIEALKFVLIIFHKTGLPTTVLMPLYISLINLLMVLYLNLLKCCNLKNRRFP